MPNYIRQLGIEAGVSLNPHTHENVLEYLYDYVDLILVMSVNPGFGGQSFIESTLPKIELTRAIIDRSGFPIRLEVDGGVKIDNIGKIAKAGADTFVAGSAIFNTDNYKSTIDALKAEIVRAQAI